MKKTILDDGSYPYLTEGAELVGEPGIPALLDIDNTQIPKDIIPFEKIKKEKNKRQYVHFYMHDKYFSNVLTSTTKYVDLLKEFDGVITPDCTLLVNQAPCIQQVNTYFSRAVGFYLQKQGIPVIANVRWSDERSFDYCFLGVPKNKIVCISTHGCLRSKEDKRLLEVGLEEMIRVLERRISLFMVICRIRFLDDSVNIRHFIVIQACLKERIRRRTMNNGTWI